ncbi:hypothetical protein DICPUDRAFT_90362 [Dictyostelium purpureum]|uniref:Methyltransferase domain-containing protein n=1 Tax=Dictyostelium purpureum TaxID=5786 RepID=F1A212_DICPU|nr:uncharacterized protein DICPUDRAFT_90362 [Dictyostelium purpureum]EGC29760.1 hypothetical protein DICPUDRAFT_90362 [Dictyostelium purpureum]|eukprot:XP_003293706.1 hypothetical protein DICPUDRAFT_90362 [Dictyostelium purpureum]
MPDYGEREYWDQRYIEEKDGRIYFDWYHGYKNLKGFLNKFMKKQDKILMIGCGNSKLGSEMYSDSYSDIINIDFSEPLIEYMKELDKGKVGLEYLTMDGRNMVEFQDSLFDQVFDKGTLDAVMCSDDDNNNAKQICLEVSRVLKPGGFFIVMTYGAPESRLPILEKSIHNWTVTMRMGGATVKSQMNQCHYIYICHKNGLDGQKEGREFPSEIFNHFLTSSLGEVPLEVLSP